MIKAIRPIDLSSVSRVYGKIPSKTVMAGCAPQVFFNKNGNFSSKIENEICQLKLQLSDHKKEYNLLRRKLNSCFGDDWIFCYSDMTPEQSDMYIECISQKGLMAKCRQKIEKLTKLVSN